MPRNDLATNSQRVDFTRTVEERIFKTPPRPAAPKLTEMKDSYLLCHWTPPRDNHLDFTCQMPDTYRGVQPDINPGEMGYYKYLDFYMSENKSKFVSYKPEQMQKAREDFPTFYNTGGVHKGFKGELPGNLHGYKNLYDKRVFRIEYPNRILSNAPKRVPHFGMTSEYQSNYPKPAYSDFYPYVQENGLYFPEALPHSSPWQDLCPPAMYRSEYCHIGTGWPVRAVVDVNK
ncbi:unnamed protein product [Ceutorhynchus assimilis]|uniref:Uncharacterized protein n=1 Tax=Ceutorhynchus assimilis TaxID=467358 RepID=A0A9N9QGM6_9CUCU|nr:unnamed protein product [Ceutorhynchus assimilis]